MHFRLLLGTCVVFFGVASFGAPPLQDASGVEPASLDHTIRPAADFYRHVNATWLSAAVIPADRVSWNAFTEVGEKVEADILALIEEIAGNRPGGEGSPARQIADMYASVTDVETINRQGGAPLRDQLERIERLRDARELAAEAGRLSSIAAGGPFGGTIVTDPRDPSRLIVQVTQGGTLLPEREHYFGAEARTVRIRSQYEHYLTTIFRLSGTADAETRARSVLALETELARAQWGAAESRDPSRTTSRFTFAQLAREMPGFDWGAWGAPQGLTVSGGVILAQPSFFKRFAELVPTVPLDTWKAWLASRYITWASPYVGDDFGNARFEFFGRILTGQEAPRPRWKRGVGMVNGYLPDLIGRVYVDRHFPRTSRDRVEKLVGQVRAAFRETLADRSWLSPSARREALGKLSALRARIGYPDAWIDYRRLTVKPDDLLGNILRAQAFDNQQRMLRATGRSYDRHWPVGAQTVNAFYSPATNEIVIPAGILQPPFFDPAADDAVNYGAIGGIVGHELMHGFDARGRRYDTAGAQRDWWTPADERAFVERARGLIDQFSGYPPIAGTPIDGTFTVIENAADLGGLAIAFQAYKRSLQGKAPPVLGGLTGEQRFFIGWARAWRGKVRDEYARETLLTDPHAPPEHRVNGPVSHLQEFYEAFGVKEGDAMFRAPAVRVKVW